MALNLAPIIPAIFTGPNGEQLTPEQIRDRQLIAQSLMGQATDTSPNAGGWASILAKGVQGFQAGRERRGADNAVSGNNTYNSDLLSSLLGGSSTTAPAASSPTLAASAATSGAAQEMASTSPAVDSSGILPASFLAAVDRTEGAGGYDTLYGHAQKNGPFAGTSISSMPIKDALAFADPSGAYGQSVKGQIGRVATPMGRYQIVGTTLKNAVGALGLDPNAPFDQRAQDSVAAYLAKQRIASADTLPGKISALRSEWHGFKSVPDNQMAQIVADLERGGTQMASASPAAAAIENIAPQDGYVDPLVSAPAYVAPQTVAPISASPVAQPLTALSAESGFDAGRFGEAPAAPVSASPMAGASPEIYSAQTDFAPELPAAVNVAPAPAVAAVQQPAAQPAQLPQAPSANTAVIAQALRVMGDPRSNDGTRRVAQALLQQEQQKQQFSQEQSVWQQRQDYERQQQNSDPLRQAQIAKLQREAATGGETFFGNPIPIQNPDGSVAYGQIGNQGTFRPIQLGQGQTFAPPTKTIDTGTETLMLDQAGNVVSRTPKQNREAAAQTSMGSAEGKNAAETASEYSSITSKMPGLYSVVDRLSNLADKATYTLAGQALDFGRSQVGMDPREAAVARAEYTATIDNQILPLLKDTFGAQFTDAEGLRLAATLGDANKTPTEKQALLKAFIQQKERDIEALRARTGRTEPQQSNAPTKPASRLKFNPQTGELE